MKFNAAVLHQINTPLVVEQLSLSSLHDRDVLVRIYASGLCHTDLEVIQGQLPYPLPIVLGHEGCGIVEAVGASVTQVRIGDRVVCSWNPFCGHCFYCQRDQPILCEPLTLNQPKGMLMDGQSRYLMGKTPVHHFSVVSSHAQYCIVPESGAVVVPQELPFNVGCLIGCGVMTGIGAALRVAKIAPGSNAVVIGAGAVGLNVIQGAALSQADQIIAIDKDPKKLLLAKTMGATHTLLANDSVLQEVKELTIGRGGDVVFECAGAEATIQLALESTRTGGQLVILGKTAAHKNIAIRFGSLMGEKKIIRSSYGGARPFRDFPWIAQKYLDGKIKLDELINEEITLDQINYGFEKMKTFQGIRTVIKMSH